MSRAARRNLVDRDGALSIRRQCVLMGISRSSVYYAPRGESAENLALMRRMDALSLQYPFYGSRQMARHLRREVPVEAVVARASRDDLQDRRVVHDAAVDDRGGRRRVEEDHGPVRERQIHPHRPGHDRRRDDRGSRRRAWEARDDAGRDLPTGVHLDQVRDLSGEPDHVGEPVVDRLQHGPVSSGWTVFRPAAGEPVVDRLQHRSSSSKRRKPSAHERTEHHVPPGDVDLPGLWTPAHRRAESGGRRGGRPQAVGNLAGERRRPCLRAGREIPTVPQRIIIIDNRVRTGLVPTMAAAGQCRSGGR